VTSTEKLVDADVLVIDDQPILLEIIREKLEAQLGPIAVFANPADAVRHLRTGERYGVLLIDIVMEPISGLELLALVRELDPFAKVIMMSAHGSMHSVVKALQLGAVDYVVKPIEDWEALERTIRRALDERKLQVENAKLLEELNRSHTELFKSVSLLRTLNETAEMMHASRDVAEILNILVKRASDVLAAERVSIMILDPDREEMALQVAAGMDRAVLKEVRVRPNEGVAGRVIATRTPMVVANADSDERVPSGAEKKKRYRGQSFMCIPIFMKAGDKSSERVIGVVNVTNRMIDRPFSEMEVEFVAHLARQAAFAMTSAALWKRHSNS